MSVTAVAGRGLGWGLFLATPIQVWDDEDGRFYAPGHVPAAAMIEAVKTYTRDIAWDWPFGPDDEDRVCHMWFVDDPKNDEMMIPTTTSSTPGAQAFTVFEG